MSVITPDQMRRIEEATERLGVSRILLMENAGASIARHVKARFGQLKGLKILVVAGTGNNGGDGFVAARHLAGYSATVNILLIGEPQDMKTDEASSNWQVIEKMVSSIKIHQAVDRQVVSLLKPLFDEADVIIDAIFGTGVKGAIRDPHSSAIDLINTSKAYRIAVDLPSGLDPLTGLIHDKAVKADVTITFHRVKQGLLKKKETTGRVIVAPIGVPPEAEMGIIQP